MEWIMTSMTVVIFYLVNKFDYHFTVGFGVHLLAMLYFTYVHRVIFSRQKQGGTSAVVIGLIGIGLGQAYNRQLIKSIVYFTIPLSLAFISQLNRTKEDLFMWSAVIFFLFTFLEAGFGTKKPKEAY